ncbi:MAG: hypothetical protein GX456_01065 [Verrucomicrobia bacterium]|nr:hypothetical protein [Verrucomicrobiota bacterium]
MWYGIALRLRQGATRGTPTQLRVCPHIWSFDLAADPDGFSGAAEDAACFGGRGALGMRQLAAALCLCANIVPGTRSA